MNYGICKLSIVPLRLEDSDRSEMVSQVLYGDLFELLEVTKKWSRIRLTYDNYEGWIDNKQFVSLTKNEVITDILNIGLLLQGKWKKYFSSLTSNPFTPEFPLSAKL